MAVRYTRPMPAAEPVLHQHTFLSGLVLVAEAIPGVRSAAMEFTVPAGLASQPDGAHGVAPLMAEWTNRGTASLDARAHSDALDRLGVRRSTGAGRRTFGLSGLCLGENLDAALPLLMDMVIRPRLDPGAFPACVDLQLQAIDSIADEPQQQCMIELRRRHLPAPLNRDPEGVAADLRGLSVEAAQAFWERQARPGGAILAFAGDLDWERLVDAVAAATEGWDGTASWDGAAGTSGSDGAGDGRAGDGGAGDGTGDDHHVASESAQTHIALAAPGTAAGDAELPLREAAVAALSGGMSARLFTEVREKRGLCYAVSASHQADLGRGDFYAYAGTTTPRAQETLDVLVHELNRLAEGLAPEEFDRVRVGAKASLVMQGESTGARASAIAADQLLRGRPRSLAERVAEFESVTLERVNAFVAEHPLGPFTRVTVGEAALQPPGVPTPIAEPA